MRAGRRGRCIGWLTCAAALVGPPTAVAHEPVTGGAQPSSKPKVQALHCSDGRTGACAAGARLIVRGEDLATVRQIVFLGTEGAQDDRSSRAVGRRPHRVTVSVPDDAQSGPLRLLTTQGPSARAAALQVERPVKPPPTAAGGPMSTGSVFPIQGRHDFGGSPVNRFGGGRGHQGQDVFAACGTPLVAANAGQVIRAGFQSAAGNHVVIARPDGQSDVYMHLRSAPSVVEGASVERGQALGEVGETGRAVGCHLHFEIWTAPGWYRGGAPMDPLPELTRWAQPTPQRG